MMSVMFTRGSELGSDRFQVVQEVKDIQWVHGVQGSHRGHAP